MPISHDQSYALELLPRFRIRLRLQQKTLQPAQVADLIRLLGQCSHLEKSLVYATLCEGYDRGLLRAFGAEPQYQGSQSGKLIAISKMDQDVGVINKIYSRKLANNIVGYQSLHYYENYLRNAVSNYLSKTISPNWHRYLLEFLARDFDILPDPDTDELRVELIGWKDLKVLLEPDLLDSAVLKKDTFDKVLTLLRKHFIKIALQCKQKSEIHARIANSNSRHFLAELSINEIHTWILKDWTMFMERPEFSRAKNNKIHRAQLQSYFGVISGYRNRTYHHASDGGAAAAVRRIKRIIDVPREYTRFLGPSVPIIFNKMKSREVADLIFLEMSSEMRKSTSIEFLRYLAKRYSLDVLREGIRFRDFSLVNKTSNSVADLEQYRPPGLKSPFAKNLETYVRSKADLTWVWWP